MVIDKIATNIFTLFYQKNIMIIPQSLTRKILYNNYRYSIITFMTTIIFYFMLIMGTYNYFKNNNYGGL